MRRFVYLLTLPNRRLLAQAPGETIVLNDPRCFIEQNLFLLSQAQDLSSLSTITSP